MDTLAALILAAAAVAAAAYTHAALPRYTAGARNVFITRTVLAAVGLASGLVAVAVYSGERLPWPFAFLIGFGTVHVPAAFILLIKRSRGSGKS
jgi:hypothetical protein